METKPACREVANHIVDGRGYGILWPALVFTHELRVAVNEKVIV